MLGALATQRLGGHVKAQRPWEGPVLGTDVLSSCPEKANATEIRYTKLKEKHSELINTHAELLRKVTLDRAQVIPSSPCHRAQPHIDPSSCT